MGKNKTNTGICFFGILALVLFSPLHALAENNNGQASSPGEAKLVLEQAVMCEDIEDVKPRSAAIAFPISIGTVFCLTSFDPVPQKSYIYHHWFRRDHVSTRIRLALNPPRWATYSSVRLREEDKGPWRVEIRDEDNNLLQTLRFSITD